jgi:hypothetical protein
MASLEAFNGFFSAVKLTKGTQVRRDRARALRVCFARALVEVERKPLTHCLRLLPSQALPWGVLRR